MRYIQTSYLTARYQHAYIQAPQVEPNRLLSDWQVRFAAAPWDPTDEVKSYILKHLKVCCQQFELRCKVACRAPPTLAALT